MGHCRAADVPGLDGRRGWIRAMRFSRKASRQSPPAFSRGAFFDWGLASAGYAWRRRRRSTPAVRPAVRPCRNTTTFLLVLKWGCWCLVLAYCC